MRYEDFNYDIGNEGFISDTFKKLFGKNKKKVDLDANKIKISRQEMRSFHQSIAKDLKKDALNILKKVTNNHKEFFKNSPDFIKFSPYFDESINEYVESIGLYYYDLNAVVTPNGDGYARSLFRGEYGKLGEETIEIEEELIKETKPLIEKYFKENLLKKGVNVEVTFLGDWDDGDIGFWYDNIKITDNAEGTESEKRFVISESEHDAYIKSIEERLYSDISNIFNKVKSEHSEFFETSPNAVKLTNKNDWYDGEGISLFEFDMNEIVTPNGKNRARGMHNDPIESKYAKEYNEIMTSLIKASKNLSNKYFSEWIKKGADVDVDYGGDWNEGPILIYIKNIYFVSGSTEALRDIVKKVAKKAADKAGIIPAGSININKNNIKGFHQATRVLLNYGQSRELINRSFKGIDIKKFGSKANLDAFMNSIKPAGKFHVAQGWLIFDLMETDTYKLKNDLSKEDWDNMYDAAEMVTKKANYTTIRIIKELFGSRGIELHPNPIGHLLSKNGTKSRLMFKLGKVKIEDGTFENSNDLVDRIRFTIGAESFDSDVTYEDEYALEDAVESANSDYEFFEAIGIESEMIAIAETFGEIEDLNEMIAIESAGFESSIKDSDSSQAIVDEILNRMDQDPILKLAKDKELIEVKVNPNSKRKVSINFKEIKEIEKILTPEDIQKYGGSTYQFLLKLSDTFNKNIMWNMKEIEETAKSGGNNLDAEAVESLKGRGYYIYKGIESLDDLIEEMIMMENGLEDFDEFKDSAKAWIKKAIAVIMDFLSKDKVVYFFQVRNFQDIQKRVRGLSEYNMDDYDLYVLSKLATLFSDLNKSKSYYYRKLKKMDFNDPSEIKIDLRGLRSVSEKVKKLVEDIDNIYNIWKDKYQRNPNRNSKKGTLNTVKSTILKMKFEYIDVRQNFLELEKKIEKGALSKSDEEALRAFLTLSKSMQSAYLKGATKAMKMIRKMLYDPQKKPSNESFDDLGIESKSKDHSKASKKVNKYIGGSNVSIDDAFNQLKSNAMKSILNIAKEFSKSKMHKIPGYEELNDEIRKELGEKYIDPFGIHVEDYSPYISVFAYDDYLLDIEKFHDIKNKISILMEKESKRIPTIPGFKWKFYDSKDDDNMMYYILFEDKSGVESSTAYEINWDWIDIETKGVIGLESKYDPHPLYKEIMDKAEADITKIAKKVAEDILKTPEYKEFKEEVERKAKEDNFLRKHMNEVLKINGNYVESTYTSIELISFDEEVYYMDSWDKLESAIVRELNKYADKVFCRPGYKWVFDKPADDQPQFTAYIKKVSSGTEGLGDAIKDIASDLAVSTVAIAGAIGIVVGAEKLWEKTPWGKRQVEARIKKEIEKQEHEKEILDQKRLAKLNEEARKLAKATYKELVSDATSKVKSISKEVIKKIPKMPEFIAFKNEIEEKSKSDEFVKEFKDDIMYISADDVSDYDFGISALDFSQNVYLIDAWTGLSKAIINEMNKHAHEIPCKPGYKWVFNDAFDDESCFWCILQYTGNDGTESIENEDIQYDIISFEDVEDFYKDRAHYKGSFSDAVKIIKNGIVAFIKPFTPSGRREALRRKQEEQERLEKEREEAARKQELAEKTRVEMTELYDKYINKALPVAKREAEKIIKMLPNFPKFKALVKEVSDYGKEHDWDNAIDCIFYYVDGKDYDADDMVAIISYDQDLIGFDNHYDLEAIIIKRLEQIADKIPHPEGWYWTFSEPYDDEACIWMYLEKLENKEGNESIESGLEYSRDEFKSIYGAFKSLKTSALPIVDKISNEVLKDVINSKEYKKLIEINKGFKFEIGDIYDKGDIGSADRFEVFEMTDTISGIEMSSNVEAFVKLVKSKFRDKISSIPVKDGFKWDIVIHYDEVSAFYCQLYPSNFEGTEGILDSIKQKWKDGIEKQKARREKERKEREETYKNKQKANNSSKIVKTLPSTTSLNKLQSDCIKVVKSIYDEVKSNVLKAKLNFIELEPFDKDEAVNILDDYGDYQLEFHFLYYATPKWTKDNHDEVFEQEEKLWDIIESAINKYKDRFGVPIEYHGVDGNLSWGITDGYIRVSEDSASESQIVQAIYDEFGTEGITSIIKRITSSK